MNVRLPWLLLLLGALAGATYGAYAALFPAPEQPRVTLRAHTGEVSRARVGASAGSADWQRAAAGETFASGDALRTAANARAALALGNRASLELVENAQLAIVGVRAFATTLRLERGAAEVRAAEGANAVVRLELRAGDAAVETVAGELRVTLLEDGVTEVSVRVGEARLVRSGRTRRVRAGETYRTASGTPVLAPRTPKGASATAHEKPLPAIAAKAGATPPIPATVVLKAAWPSATANRPVRRVSKPRHTTPAPPPVATAAAREPPRAAAAEATPARQPATPAIIKVKTPTWD